MATPHRFRPEGVKVTFRKMKFDFEQTGFSPHWHSNNPFISHFWNSLSQAFSPGEKFFIDSVRALRDRVEDPEMLAEMEEFVRQEAAHTIEHRRFNRMVGGMGYDVERLERRYALALGIARKFVDAKGMLEVTMALEHFTSGFAHQYFENPDVARGADPNVEALWGWHAAEEMEHKATAFDVYKDVGGSYFGRAKTLAPSWAMIVAITLVNVFDMMIQDGSIRDVSATRKGLTYLFGRRGLFTGMVPAFLAYLKPSFHPWDEDDSQGLKEWEANVAGRYLQSKGRKKRLVPAPVTSKAVGAPRERAPRAPQVAASA
jgi:uncharacterized protein